MSSLASVLAVVAILVGADAKPQYEGQTLTEWKAAAQPAHSLKDREKAIDSLGCMARASEDSALCEDILATLMGLFRDQHASIGAAASAEYRKVLAARKDGVSILAKFLDSSTQQYRWYAAGTLQSMGSIAAAAVPDLEKMLRKPADRSDRGAAVEALLKIAPEQLMKLLDDKDAEVRKEILERARWLPVVAKMALPGAIRMLDDKDADIRQAAVDVAFAISAVPDEAIKAVPALLRDKSWRVRNSTVSGLQRTGATKRFVPELSELVFDSNKYVRHELAVALGCVGKEAVSPLLMLLSDQDAAVRAEAADAFEDMGSDGIAAVPVLHCLLTDMAHVPIDQGLVCNHAGFALRSITGDSSALRGLPKMPRQSK